MYQQCNGDNHVRDKFLRSFKHILRAFELRTNFQERKLLNSPTPLLQRFFKIIPTAFCQRSRKRRANVRACGWKTVGDASHAAITSERESHQERRGDARDLEESIVLTNVDER